ncbi:LysE family translocator [Pendulispora albinea]|uniref:LysE family translocator n=1 Tax=Pendulispora albinea TaxID=2741071 RepID=A0ABZ2M6L9_9BACT
MSSALDLFNGFNLPAAIAYAFTLTATPGPNNVMVMSSGANHRYRRTVPCLLGMSVGCTFIVALSAAGLGVVFNREPRLRTVLFFVGAAYLCWLAWQIGSSGAPAGVEANARAPARKPLSFLQGAVFQFANPKTWLMGINIVVLFSLPGAAFIPSMAAVCTIVLLVSFFSMSLWAGFGVAIHHRFRTERAWRIFNIVMALLLLACVPMLFW